jgi:hypothetical protein
VSVIAVNAFGASVPTGSVIIPVVVPVAGGRVEINQTTHTVGQTASGDIVILGEVANRGVGAATFVELTAAFRNAQGQVMATHSTFLRGHPRRITSTGSIDDSALAPGELGCFYLRAPVKIANVASVAIQVTHDNLPSSAMASDVNVLDVDSVPVNGVALVGGIVSNSGPAPTFFNSPVISFKRDDGRSIGCDFTFVSGSTYAVPGGVTTDTVLLPGQAAQFAAITHAPAPAVVYYGWMQWQEVTGEPLATLAAQTYDSMRRAPNTDEGRREAIALWEALQRQRRTLARQVSPQ